LPAAPFRPALHLAVLLAGAAPLAVALACAASGAAQGSGVNAPRPKDKPLSASDRKANTGERLAAAGRESFNTTPSGAFVDLAVTTVGAALHDDYMGASGVVGALMQDGLACMAAKKPSCKFEKGGVSFDFVTGRHALTLYPVDGFSKDPRKLATEDASGIHVTDANAFGYVLNEEKSAIRSITFGSPSTGARDVSSQCAPPSAKP
jgi:hypothetical protein